MSVRPFQPPNSHFRFVERLPMTSGTRTLPPAMAR